ncbi:MAG: HAMP domain-containing histidine kinase [Butyrivibrio sp.]|nr:HAMP domain-containing histidine kinase [Muribaculum sp.]MCM1551967.1 HAMP domain-containing histidine kinase [Butyrivibrio sp.]
MRRFIFVIVSLYLAALVSLLCIFSIKSQDKIKNTEANDVIWTINNYWPDVDYAISTMREYEIDYIMLGEDGKEIAASRDDLQTDYRHNYIHKDYSVDVRKDGEVQGKIIFINNEDAEFKNRVKIWALSFFAIFLLKDVLIFFYLKKQVFLPVRKINAFARQIAEGNLDVPIGRADSGSFGAFAESFDIMREELLYARKREQEADKSRREVIASISHDIKNPIASIQAVAEYQSLTSDSEELRQEFQTIVEKTNQINGMISNLHISMLNDLDRLVIDSETTESFVIIRALRQADYKKRVGDFEIPECLVMIDKVRIFQIMDNIISNSYKYADTAIEIRSYFEDSYLCICIRDFGNGVKKEEEIFLTQKYFRGQNAKDKEGSGMGMYIVEYLIKGMGGKLRCCSKEGEWFEVKLWLVLAA